MTLPYPNISTVPTRAAVYNGAAANDNTGDPLRTAFTALNARDLAAEVAVDQAKVNFDSLDLRTNAVEDRATALEGAVHILNWRGSWVTGTAYVFTPGVRRDYFVDSSTGDAYVVLQSHTSTTLAADEAAGKIGNIDSIQLRADLGGVGAGQGADMVGFQHSGSGATERKARDKMRESASFDDYLTSAELTAALSGSVVDMTASMNEALAAHRCVRAVAGRTYRFTTLTMAVDDTTLVIEGGAKLMPSSATVKGVDVTGARCAIVGEGSIDSPSSWDGTNARRTFGTIWVTGEGFTARGITLNNVPRSGIHFEDATGWLVEGVKINGGFPYASYTGTQTGHCGIDYNPTTTAAATDYQSGRVTGCRIRACVQGVFQGNFDSYGSTAGLQVTSNVFEDCWNHGVYLTLAEAPNISANTFIDCQVPIVADGTGAKVSSNVLYTTEPNTRTNSWQIIQVRDASAAVITDNVLYGVDAGISLECVTATTISGNTVSGNRIHRTARAATGWAIRCGVSAQTCKNNKITGNTITGTLGIYTGNAIELNMAAGYYGVNNQVEDNIIDLDDAAQCIYSNLQIRPKIRRNTMRCAGSLASLDAIRMLFVIATTYADISRNEFAWETGGTNVALRAIQTSGTVTANRYEDNLFRFTSGSLSSIDTLAYVGGGGQSYSRNHLDGGLTPLHGSATITPGNSAVVVTNANVVAAYSRVFVQAANATGASVQAYVVVGAGNFTINTASGSAVAANATYTWRIE